MYALIYLHFYILFYIMYSLYIFYFLSSNLWSIYL